ncbi:MAG: hypothetical protein WKF96_17800 [Solirubrobacteraceae bacterium]
MATFAPWVTAPFGVSENGLGGDFGTVVLLAFVGAAAALYFHAQSGQRSFAALAAIAGVVSLIASIAQVQVIQSDTSVEFFGERVDGVLAVGWGLQLAEVASLVLAVAAVVLYRELRPLKAEEPPPPERE